MQRTHLIYIGHDAEAEICVNLYPRCEVIEIKTNILNFYKKLCHDVISRIDITNKRLNILRYFDPIFVSSKQDINSFEIVSEFKDIIVEPETFINEFKLLETNINSKAYEDLRKITNAEKFWFEIGNLKNRFGEKIYSNLYEFITYVFTLPHSSASAERIFSKLSLIKDKLTNKLKIETCESMLSSLNLLESELEEWTPSTELLTKYR